VHGQDELIPRRALATAKARLVEGRIVVVNGPRQSGKSEILRMLNAELGGTLSTFDDRTQLELAQRDPFGFVSEFARPHMIDEVQRGGDAVLLAVKRSVDQSRQLGQFVLAGSTRFLSEPRLSDSLAGRVRLVDLWPLSQGEIDRSNDDLVLRCFSAPERVVASLGGLKALTRQQIFERVVRGGFPEAVLASSESARRSFFDSYIRTVTRRDVRELASIRLAADMPRLSRLLLSRTGNELNVASLGSQLRMSEDTLRRYVALLETVYLVHLLPAWSRNLSNRQRHRPKVHAVDTGLAAAAQHVMADHLAKPDAVTSGGLLETFVVNECIKQLSWGTDPIEAYHWREDQGREVDLVLERADGAVVAVEVKAGIDIRSQDLRGLSLLRDRIGDDFLLGLIVHCGPTVQQLGPRLVGVPVSALWHG
jgi:predicted AAA+ superfamily ATPase